VFSLDDIYTISSVGNYIYEMAPSIDLLPHNLPAIDPSSKHCGCSEKAQENGLSNGITHASITQNGEAKPQFQIPSEQPYGSRKKMRVAMIGAGISGLNLFKVAEEKLQNVDIICYEKNKDIGGT
jgi:hypothetical protein